MDSAEFDVIMNGVDNGVAEMTDAASGSLSSFNEQLDAESQAANAAANSNGKMGISLSDLNAGMEVINKTLGYAKQAYGETIGKSQAYAEQIRNLSQVSGESAENTSRFVQVLDDWQVSAEDAMTATKALTKQGLAPNIDTIADLSEKYLSLSNVEDQNAFVTKNLGKAGLEWVNVLKQGPDALRAQAAAVSDNLILSDKQIEQAEQLRLAQDQLNDSIEGLKISIGTKLTPAYSGWIRLMNDATTGQIDLQGAMVRSGAATNPIKILTQLYGEALQKNTVDLENATQAEKDHAKIELDVIEIEKARKEAADARNATLTTQLSLTASIQSQMDTYSASTVTITAQQGELQVKIQELISQGYDPLGTNVLELRDKYTELGAKAGELAAQNAEAMAKMRIDNLQAKLAVDGISDADYELIIAEQLKAGIISKTAADQSVAMNNLNTLLANGKVSQADYDKAVADGSFSLETTNARNIKSYDGYLKSVQDSSFGITAKTDTVATKATEAASVTKTATDASITAWDTAKTSIHGILGGIEGDIDAYIGKIKEVPNSWLTEFKATFPTLTDTSAGANSVGAGVGISSQPGTQTIVNNYYYQIERAEFSADHEIRATIQ